MAVIMVEERFDPPIDVSQGSPIADKVSPCLPVYDVTWMSSYIANDGSRCVCVYESENAEAARRVYRAAGVPFENVLGSQSPAPLRRLTHRVVRTLDTCMIEVTVAEHDRLDRAGVEPEAFDAVGQPVR